MKNFKGFPSQFDHTRIPTPFFTELLPAIDHLGELIVTIYYFWQIEQMEGDFRYVRLQEFFDDGKLIANIGKNEIVIGLEKAVERGTLLKGEIELDNENIIIFFLNTQRGRNAVKALAEGLWTPSGNAKFPITLDMERPNIFRLYEENIGPLTPIIADALKEAEKIYPFEWIKEAISKSIENNVHNWRYVSAILERWQKEGKNGQTKKNRRSTEKDRKKYTEW